MTQFIRLAILISGTFLFSEFATAQSFVGKMGVNATVDLNQLARSGQVDARFSSEGYRVSLDASAVLSGIQFEKLRAVSLEFNRWAQWSMPGVKAMRVISWQDQELVVWAHMAQTGATSKHFQKIRLDWNPTPGAEAFGNTFELFSPSETVWQNGQQLENAPAFRQFRGSWYLQTLPTSDIYVRYFVEASIKTDFPAWLVEPIVKYSMPDGVERMIEILAREARIRR